LIDPSIINLCTVEWW